MLIGRASSDITGRGRQVADLKNERWFGRFWKPCGSLFGPAESPPLNFITYIYVVYNSLQNNVSIIKFDAVSAFLSQIIVLCRASTIQIYLKSRIMSLPPLFNWLKLQISPLPSSFRSYYSSCESAAPKWWRNLKTRDTWIRLQPELLCQGVLRVCIIWCQKR